MSTGYGHLADEEFWAEVAALLALLVRHHGGTWASQVGGLADYVHAEAERRDPELAASARRRAGIVRAADARAPSGLDALAADLPFTPGEEAEWQDLITGYNQRFADLAGCPGGT